MSDDGGNADSPWLALRRRKLVQWALAYAAAAWVLLQVLGLLSSTYGCPVSAMRNAVGVVALGFCVALVLAWFHGERGVQRVGAAELAILTLLLAVGGAALWRMESGAASKPVAADAAAPAAGAPAPAAPRPNSIAVLPFLDMSQTKDQEYLSDGIAEELLNLLAKVRELRVTSRSSAFSFKGKEVDVPTIAKRLNVAHVLEGSVRKAGNQVRVTVQLIEAGSDTHLWSETYDRPLDNIFAIQDEIAAAVVAQLKVSLLGAVPKATATDPAAYALFLQGRQLDREGSAASIAQAIERYQQALAIAPDYVAAWERLSAAYQLQAGRGLRPVDEGARLARQAAERALALDPSNAMALGDLGFLALLYDRDLVASAHHIERALALEPGNSEIVRYASRMAISLNRPELAIALGKRFVESDPANASGRVTLCRAYLDAWRYDEALACYQEVLAISPGIIAVHQYMVMTRLAKGGREAAEAALADAQAEPAESYRLYALALAQYALGNRAASDAALAQAVSKYERDSAYNIAYAYAYRGEADLAFTWLEKAMQYSDSGLPDVAVNPLFKPLYADPRWLAYLTRIGYAPAQLAAIRFEVAAPEPGAPAPTAK